MPYIISIRNTLGRLVKHFRLLLRWQDLLVDPASDVASVVVVLRGLAIERELSTLSIFARHLARWQLHVALESLLNLLSMRGFVIDGLIDAFPVLHLLRFVAGLRVQEMSSLVRRWYQVHFVKVNRILRE